MNLIKLCIILLILIPLGLGWVPRVFAQEFETSNYSISININEDGSAVFNIERTIKNKDNLNLIDGYEYVFPSEVPNRISATLNGESLKYDIVGSFQNYSKVHFNFPKVIKPGEIKNLRITATVDKFMKNLGDLRYFSILASDDDKVDLSISFPSDFGEPSLITADSYSIIENAKAFQLTLFQPDSLLVLWPNDYSVNINTRFTIANNSDENANTLIPIINENPNQKAFYHSSLGGSFGLIDENKNSYAYYNLQPSTSKEIDVDLTVAKKGQNYKLESEISDISWPSNEITSKLGLDTKDDLIVQNKMENAYNILRKMKPISDIEDTNYEDNDNYWDYLVKKEFFTSFDYCYVLSAFAIKNGIKAQMEYGYELIASNFFPKKVPQFWCTFEYPDGQIEQFDFVTHSVYGFDLHTLGSSITKLTFGYWNPNLDVRDPLGLLIEDEYIQTIEFISDEEYLPFQNNLLINSGSEVNATSGFYHNLDLTVINNTEQFLPIIDLKYEGRSYNDSYGIEDYKYALLPLQSNKLELQNLRIENFLFQGARQIEIEVTAEGENEIKANSVILAYYSLDARLLFGFISIISILLFLVLMFIWIIFIKRKNNQYIRRGMY